MATPQQQPPAPRNVAHDLTDAEFAELDELLERTPEPLEPVQLLGARLEAQHQHRVDALGQQVGLEDPVPGRGVAREVVEQEVVTALTQDLLGALDHGCEEPASHPRDDHGDGPGLAAGQSRGAR